MLLEKIKTPDLFHLSYLIGSGGKAAVIDPRRNCECYVEMARADHEGKTGAALHTDVRQRNAADDRCRSRIECESRTIRSG